jgi:hypothetical protein
MLKRMLSWFCEAAEIKDCNNRYLTGNVSLVGLVQPSYVGDRPQKWPATNQGCIFKSSFVKEKGSSRDAFGIIYTGPSMPPSIRRMGFFDRDSYSWSVCLQMPQGAMGWSLLASSLQ